MSETNGLYPKIARIMGRLNRLPKTGRNKHFNYAFVTDADVADAVRKELASENVAFFASMINATQEGKHSVATFEFTFVCGDTGERQVCMWVGEANDTQDKGLTKAATSAEKYFLLKTFMLSAGDVQDDPDSGDEQPQPAPRQQSAPEPSELDKHFGLKTPHPGPYKVNGHTWQQISGRLIEDKLAKDTFEAFGRLKKIASAELKDFDDKKPYAAIVAAGWTEADLVAKFKARIAEKENK